MIRRVVSFLLLIPSLAWATCPLTDAYSTAVCADNPRHYLRMDASSGTTETDVGSSPYETGGNPAMTYIGSYTLSQGGALGSAGISDTAVAFGGSGRAERASNGVGSAGACGPNDDIGPINWSESFWTYENPVGNYWVAYNCGASCTSSNGVVNWNFPATTTLSMGICFGDGSSPSAFCLGNKTIAARTANTWHNYVITAVGTSGGHISDAKWYYDTTLNDSGSYSATSLRSCDSTTVIALAGYPGTSSFNGRIDEVASYTTILSSGRITAQYLAATTTSGGKGWPFITKAPELPRFLDGGYWKKFVAKGYNTGLFAPSVKMPRYLLVGYLPFAIVPNTRGD